MPATVEGVRTFLGLSPARPVDDDALAAAVAASNAAVVSWRVDLAALDVWPANAEQAATLYAARLYGRRASVQGVAAFQEVGGYHVATGPRRVGVTRVGQVPKVGRGLTRCPHLRPPTLRRGGPGNAGHRRDTPPISPGAPTPRLDRGAATLTAGQGGRPIGGH